MALPALTATTSNILKLTLHIYHTYGYEENFTCKT